MELHTLYFNTYKKILNKKSDWYKSRLIKNKSEYITFNKTSNESLTSLTDYIEKLIAEENNIRYMEFLNVFNSRHREYNVKHEELIIKNELKTAFHESELSASVPYDKFIITLAEYSAIKESSRIIQNGYNYYQLIYTEDLINEEFIFYSDDYIKDDKFYKLRDKIYPPLVDTSIDITTEEIIKVDETQPLEILNFIEDNTKINKEDPRIYVIMLGNTEFNRVEFALYHRMWRDSVASEMKLRELYDKVIMDFNDPFDNFSSFKRYDSDPFYKNLKNENPKDTSEFNLCLALKKILKIISATNNNVFSDYIKQKISRVEVENRCM